MKHNPNFGLPTKISSGQSHTCKLTLRLVGTAVLKFNVIIDTIMLCFYLTSILSVVFLFHVLQVNMSKCTIKIHNTCKYVNTSNIRMLNKPYKIRLFHFKKWMDNGLPARKAMEKLSVY